MKTETTKITSISIHIGEGAIQGTYVKTDLFGELYGYLFTGETTLFFNSKESINSLQNALTELKEKWLVVEQEEVPASA